MDEPNTDVIQGHAGHAHSQNAQAWNRCMGFGIARRIEQISRGVFKVNPGSLLTAFHKRLERVGWLDSEWSQTDNSRRAKVSIRSPRSGPKTA